MGKHSLHNHPARKDTCQQALPPYGAHAGKRASQHRHSLFSDA
eukprot:CAMPEP_0172834160 /NCGR_PEP_ID=MMETSP1075-20121228/24868_1 /TAXON_ID=2916 /ORGANISM="Ceratium fusus, Strain PA161109" /LENGTH=42 /DNA_ID= /DNA_START= /DNA_END= /DNA_ORIENTATION=